MQKTLYLLRHAHAETGSSGTRDADRALSPRGLAEAAALCAQLQSVPLPLEHLLLSPARRTQQTWDGVRGAFANPPAPTVTESIYLASAGDLLHLCQHLPAAVRHAWIIGHNPGLHQLANILCAAGDAALLEDIHLEFPPCALAVIHLDITHWHDLAPGSGRLLHFITPRHD